MKRHTNQGKKLCIQLHLSIAISKITCTIYWHMGNMFSELKKWKILSNITQITDDPVTFLIVSNVGNDGKQIKHLK